MPDNIRFAIKFSKQFRFFDIAIKAGNEQRMLYIL